MDDFMQQIHDKYFLNVPKGDGDAAVIKVIESSDYKKDAKFLCDVIGFSIPKKPTWPYEKLILIDGNDKTETLKQKGDSSNLMCHKTDFSELPLVKGSILRKLICKSQYIVEIDAEYENFVRKSVQNFINKSLKELQAKYLMFKDSFLVEVGSMAEGTRIIEPSEIDFLIVLPELANEKSCNLYFAEAILSIFIQDDLRKEMRTWIKKFPIEDRLPGFELDSYHPFYFLRGALELAIRNNIPDGMSFLIENKNHKISRTNERGQGRSSMFHFGIECSGRRKLFMSVDLCFSIPLDTNRIEKILIKSSIDATYLNFIYNRCTESSSLVCAVMNSSSICISADRYHFVTNVTKFSEHVDAKKCYKTVKYFMKLFLPQTKEDFCFICSKSIISSYAIKTIIFYMMEYYTDPSYWNEENLGNRLIEVFEILLYSQFTLRDNICYLWRQIEIHVYNLDPSFITVPRMENAIEFIATKDCRILRKVSEYWQVMGKKTDHTELITQFLHLLKCLRDSDEGYTTNHPRI